MEFVLENPVALLAWLDAATLSHPAIRWPLTVIYLTVLLVICVYGIHRYWLVWLFYQRPGGETAPRQHFDDVDLPCVTVQLPMYNEAAVAARIIDAACALEYPADRLQIQVLDDSTDGSGDIARARVEHWASKGVDIEYLRRDDRIGFKAGALHEATSLATGELIVIFDADFVPLPDFLQRTVHYFTDEKLGCVQARWGHLNRHASLLTRSQAVFLDGHFIIEHDARHRAERWFNFNGTAGIWRRQAITDAGGWQHDTLTEDVDLSYRAQMAGWRFKFLPHVICPAELPPEINAFKAQQHRWTKGSIQTAKKLLPALLRSDAPLAIKTEAFFHLTSPVVYICIVLLTLLFYPALLVNLQGPMAESGLGAAILFLSLFSLGTASAGAFYVASQRAQGRGWLAALSEIPMLMSIGVGISANNARGVIAALLGIDSPFVRTAKYNTVDEVADNDKPRHQPSPSHSQPIWRRTPSVKFWMGIVEIILGLYVLACAAQSLTQGGGTLISFPFLMLFVVGYLYVGLSSIWVHLHSRSDHTTQPLVPQTS